VKYLLDFLGIQPAENPGGPLPNALTKLTKPLPRGRNPAPPPTHATDETDETPRPATDATVPEPDGPGLSPSGPAVLEAWPGEHAALTQENRRVGYDPTAAASLALQYLRARDACPWRQVLPTWPDDRRLRWGLRAGQLQDGGIGWREAEEQAFVEVSAEAEVLDDLDEGPPAPRHPEVQTTMR
jgi:hypothetical protein